MAILKPVPKNSIRSRVIPLTPLNLFVERLRAVSDGVRIPTQGLTYTPLQFGGLKGQQQSLLAESAVRIIDFKITGK